MISPIVTAQRRRESGGMLRPAPSLEFIRLKLKLKWRTDMTLGYINLAAKIGYKYQLSQKFKFFVRQPKYSGM